ncbi:hypothetical protein [Spirosoma areae]
MAYRPYTNTGDTIPGWASGEERFFVYDDALSCDEGDDLFDGLSPAQKIAQTTAVEPVYPSGKVARNCGGGGSNPPPAGTFGLDGDPIEGGDDGSEQSNDALN